MTLLEKYRAVRAASEAICQPLQKEDYVVQPIADVSPPKWHLGHTTWFWEAFVLTPHQAGYQSCNPDYNYVFNSYYETIGARVVRTDRGNLSRPSVDEIYSYRRYVDENMTSLIAAGPGQQLEKIIILGLNHEQQHQELLYTDIKYILGHNPLFPAWSDHDIDEGAPPPQPGSSPASGAGFLSIPAGLYEIGYEGNEFCFDNEQARHKVYLNDFQIAAGLVTNEEWLAFMEAGGYKNFRYWHAEGWDWVKNQAAGAPLYWHFIEDRWHQYTMAGLRPLDKRQPVCHINYYEATAYAAWKGSRLPTEWEWEAASAKFGWGKRWEWTESAYLPYPGFTKAEGAIGEYNGKFMVSQMVLRGASVATPAGHSRPTYRNFFHPHLRWQFTGIRLAK
ncbi:MAG TPA: ergothioneine biosynthesis protein EgtB [Puia sp.]|jgi:ergothioneine biosynthesis protein EgtB|nr:ergothioneine biosynthesis protein EgtB [Puia sp.]